MEEGSMRCDANVSLRRAGSEYGTKVEIKNLNSIRSLGRALVHEIERQTRLLYAGEHVVQETRHFDEGAGVTKTLRSKEEAFDYRYFPEPDLLPLAPDAAWLSSIRAALPELPAARRARLAAAHDLTAAQAAAVGGSVAWSLYFEETVAAGASGRDAAVWMSGEVSRALNAAGGTIEEARVSPPRLAALIAAVKSGTVNLNTAKRVFQLAFASGDDPAGIIAREGMAQVSDTAEIEKAIEQVLAENAPEVERFRAGEEKVLGFLVGKAMRALGGKGNPKLVNEVLHRALGAS
jgi:aspartyl-tRNA(Asn)/glutamyl-tRNA(Gln) amidotransferase subunit B